MPTDRHARLTTILSELVQVQNAIDSILGDPLYPDVGELAEELSDLTATLKALVEVRLERMG